MTQEILINVTASEFRIALLENRQLREVHIERAAQQKLFGNIYKGRVHRLIPGIQAAFVDIGLDRCGFLHFSDSSESLYVGKSLLVQVYKDKLGSKGPRLTSQLTIPSRYLVFAPGLAKIAVSQKITDPEVSERLLQMIQLHAEGGYIFRSAAVHATQADIDADKNFLDQLWQEIKTREKTLSFGNLVYSEIPFILRILRDFLGYNVEKIWVDDSQLADTMREYATRYIPNGMSSIQLYQESTPLFDAFGVEAGLKAALQRKVNLKSGGHLIFDQTEAMTTIDVNTGSYLGITSDLEETIFKTNLEAAAVIAQQMRLRNLGGIIIVDFIDMTESKHRQQLLEVLTQAVAEDSAKVNISELSTLGLVQITRKRTQESLQKMLHTACPTCEGSGSVKSIPTIGYEIFRALIKELQQNSMSELVVMAAEKVIDYLLENEAEKLADLETRFDKKIQLQKTLKFLPEEYTITGSRA